MDQFRHFEGVATLAMDEKACVGCGMCTMVCPHGVVALHNGKARVADIGACMECGACAINCPTGAVSVTPGVGCAAYIIQTWIRGKSIPLDAKCC